MSFIPLDDMSACKDYVSKAVKISTQPYCTSAYIWVRFLTESYCEDEGLGS